MVEPDLPASAQLGVDRPDLSPRRIRWLFASGIVGGVTLMAVGIARSGHDQAPLPPGAVARVGEAVVSRAEYERTLAALARDRKSPLTSEDRVHALQRLIDEELLLNRALELELPRTDVRARRALVSALIDSIVATQEHAEVSDEELRRFYEANRDWFSGPDLFHVRQIWFRVDSPAEAAVTEARARAAYEKIVHGEPFDVVRQAMSDPESPPLPDAPLPATKVGELLGPTVLRTVMELGNGDVSPPVRSATGFHILRLVERRAGLPPNFEDIRAQVANEFRRRAADQALRTYLDELRSRTTIVLAPEALKDLEGTNEP